MIYTKRETEINKTISLESTESLIDATYEGLVSLMHMVHPDKRNTIPVIQTGLPKGTKDLSPFKALMLGIYYPGIERNYLTGEIQVSVDELIDEGCVYMQPYREHGEIFKWAHVTKRSHLNKRDWLLKRETLKHSQCFYECNIVTVSEGDRGVSGTDRWIYKSAFAVMPDGRTEIAVNRHALRENPRFMDNDFLISNHYGPGTVNVLNDARLLWNVEVSEPIRSNMSAKLRFGVDSEWVKSLFFARETPLTVTGRKKPILHWVKQHKRRIKERKKIDIPKHLRGITEVKLGELTFNITQPIKRVA
jgi:hypothetical protein